MENKLTINDALGRPSNNFKLLRFCAAMFVLLGHVYLLRWGAGSNTHFIMAYFDYRLGLPSLLASFGVNGFFIISGFLLLKSLCTKSSLWDYAVSRSLRIYPALMLMGGFTVFAIGAYYATLPVDCYLFNLQTLQVWLKTSLAISVSAHLPGVFSDNPFPIFINMPLWTLKYEMLAYITLLGLWVVGVARSSRMLVAATGVFLLVYFVVTLGTDIRMLANENAVQLIDNLLRFGLCFLVGMLCYQFRENIPLNGTYALALACLALTSYQSRLFEFAVVIAIGYLVFWFAFVPDGILRNFNKFGDYSYGIYIFHWPVLQFIVARYPEIGLLNFAVLGIVITLILSVFSWHFVEYPALSSRTAISLKFQRATNRIFAWFEKNNSSGNNSGSLDLDNNPVCSDVR